MARQIRTTFDYRCPFARNAHEAVVAAIREGDGIDWQFVPFSLDQAHVEEDEAPVWDRAPDERGTGVLSLTWGIAVRDSFPDQFLDFHVAAFAARHDHGQKLGHESVLRDVAGSVGLDPDLVGKEVATGEPLKRLAAEHTEMVDAYAVFGVPTFIEGEEAVFIRFMERGRADDLRRALELIEWARFNEFKRTRIPR
ncbi:MAG: DsbA family protein [Acidimicrobiia bacterium]